MAADEQELSPQQVADRLGFSREHVVRLVNAGELEMLNRGDPARVGARVRGAELASG